MGHLYQPIYLLFKKSKMCTRGMYLIKMEKYIPFEILTMALTQQCNNS